MADQEKEKSQELGLIDITEILSDYLRIFRRMWAWVLIFTILGAGLFYVRARLQYQPVYTASATFTVNIQREQQGIADAGSTSFFNNSTAEQVAKDMNVSSVPGAINASVAENTNLLTISVTDQDAGRAYATLKSVEENYPAISEVIVGKVNMEMLDETGIPAEPDNPKAFRGSTVKGAAVGLLLVMIWTGILVVTRRTVRKESDIRRWMNTRCLGTVPEVHEKRRSKSTIIRMILTDPKVEEKMQESFRIIRNKLEYNAQEYHMKTFLVTSALAGEGKSTVAVNLALSLAQAGHKVALVDCDLRHPTDRQILGCEEGEYGLREVLERKVKLNECLMGAGDLGFEPEMRIIFLPGGQTINDGSELLGTQLMGRIIKKLEKISDYVILDSAPAGLLTDAVVLAQYADGAVFVVRKDFARVDYIMDGMEHLAESNIQIIGGVLNGI